MEKLSIYDSVGYKNILSGWVILDWSPGPGGAFSPGTTCLACLLLGTWGSIKKRNTKEITYCFVTAIYISQFVHDTPMLLYKHPLMYDTYISICASPPALTLKWPCVKCGLVGDWKNPSFVMWVVENGIMYTAYFAKNRLSNQYTWHYTVWQENKLVAIFTNPSARAGYDTRSVFKWSLTGLNSEFFLLLD